MFYEIKFPSTEKNYFLESDNDQLKTHDEVIVDNGQIIEYAVILRAHKEKTTDQNNEEFSGRIVRKLSDEDKTKIKELKTKATDLIPVCQEKVEMHNFPTMKLLGAELSYDEKKLTFYFSADGRIDFRELVTDLVRTFNKIIRLQQIGSRDEAKIFGGYGKCGRKLCCTTHLGNVESITLDLAKEQDIFSSSNKLYGACGKLMCCLAYELEEYKILAEKMPKIGDKVKVNNINGKVIFRSLIKQSYTIEKEDGQRMDVEL